MTETRADYTPSLGTDIEGNGSPDYHNPPEDDFFRGPADLTAIEMRAKGLSRYGQWCDVRQDLDVLLAEVQRLRAESEIWEKYSLVGIVKERDSLRALLDQEQHARITAEQDADHWRGRASDLQGQVTALQTQVAQLAEALEMATGLA